MENVKIGQIVIGKGLPKIITPMVGQTEKEILEEARMIQQTKGDIAEWRIDYFENVQIPETVAKLSHAIKALLKKPLLITFRSVKEGGQQVISDQEYLHIYQMIIQLGKFDLLDIEFSMPIRYIDALIYQAHLEKIKVIISNHEFEQTPAQEELINRLQKMQKTKADICKIAVMPHSTQDVLTLLQATQIMKKNHADRPLIALSMGTLGKISRIAGQLIGSDATFGIISKSSAPGQLPLTELHNMINSLKIDEAYLTNNE
ncbi:type I 3-dehydroquinate dehydratase [Melissococcus plutonius]|uniref:type I 3-dehydroquinate dehydratase n=1 Tax=Melissococcus plutonius TaxID=33970 RepID=UPI0021E56E39|nr:type I 3-dehydroquinate dehydratase [Melissococcus plutonius]MCV2526951.1 type I 3-dehydroquinate dehydratase [Melissococcus plutonius]